jgi:chromosome segregation ATPase
MKLLIVSKTQNKGTAMDSLEDRLTQLAGRLTKLEEHYTNTTKEELTAEEKALLEQLDATINSLDEVYKEEAAAGHEQAADPQDNDRNSI